MQSDEVCRCHSGLKMQVDNTKEDVNNLFAAVRARTPLWAFVLLVSMVVSSLGLQWTTYISIIEVSKRLAVLEDRQTRQGASH